MMPKKMEDKKEAEVHEDLKGFNINIDAFGQLTSSMSIDKLNGFLNKKNEEEE